MFEMAVEELDALYNRCSIRYSLRCHRAVSYAVHMLWSIYIGGCHTVIASASYLFDV